MPSITYVIAQYWVHHYDDLIEVKESELFCDRKTNLNIRFHAFSCSKGSNLFPLMFIDILSMTYFAAGQS
jgi:hypothetical protein